MMMSNLYASRTEEFRSALADKSEEFTAGAYWMYRELTGRVFPALVPETDIMGAMKQVVLTRGYNWDRLFSRDRSAELVDMRAKLYYLYREMTGASEEAIARAFGGKRGRCTIHHALISAAGTICYDQQFAYDVEQMEKEIRLILNQ